MRRGLLWLSNVLAAVGLCVLAAGVPARAQFEPPITFFGGITSNLAAIDLGNNTGTTQNSLLNVTTDADCPIHSTVMLVGQAQNSNVTASWSTHDDSAGNVYSTKLTSAGGTGHPGATLVAVSQNIAHLALGGTVGALTPNLGGGSVYIVQAYCLSAALYGTAPYDTIASTFAGSTGTTTSTQATGTLAQAPEFIFGIAEWGNSCHASIITNPSAWTTLDSVDGPGPVTNLWIGSKIAPSTGGLTMGASSCSSAVWWAVATVAFHQ